MRGTSTVFTRELGAYFDSAIAYVTCIAGLLVATSLYMNEFFLTGSLDMTPFFDLLPLLFVFFLPAITMRLWSEDLRTRTFELWMTLPLSTAQVVGGKYLAACALYLVFLLGTVPIVGMLCVLGEPDLGRIFSGYLGALLLGAQFISFGMLLSALTSDQIVAFLTAALVGFVFVSSGEERVVAVIDGLAPGMEPGRFISDSVSCLPHYEHFVRGVVRLPSVLYFLGMATVFCALSAFVVRRRRG